MLAIGCKMSLIAIKYFMFRTCSRKP